MAYDIRECKHDFVPESIYEHAANVLIAACVALGADEAVARMRVEEIDLKHSRTGNFLIGGKMVKARYVRIAFNTRTGNIESGDDVVVIKGVSYKHEIITSVKVLLTKDDVIILKHSFDLYESVDGKTAFCNNIKLEPIELKDIPGLIQTDNK